LLFLCFHFPSEIPCPFLRGSGRPLPQKIHSLPPQTFKFQKPESLKRREKKLSHFKSQKVSKIRERKRNPDLVSIPNPYKLLQVHAELTMEVPVEHGLLLENLLDLAHAPFTHTSTFARDGQF
jgi:phenylpropionate dioxygenase-like ring-hydroxylating dioxygenase large terminal subunit